MPQVGLPQQLEKPRLLDRVPAFPGDLQGRLVALHRLARIAQPGGARLPQHRQHLHLRPPVLQLSSRLQALLHRHPERLPLPPGLGLLRPLPGLLQHLARELLVQPLIYQRITDRIHQTDLQFLARPVQARGHRVVGQVQELGDLAVAQAPQIVQGNDQPVVVTQPAQTPVQKSVGLRSLQVLCGRWIRARQGVLHGVQGRVRPLPATPLPALVSRELPQPRREPARLPQLVQVQVRADKGLLGNVLGVGKAAGPVIGQTVHGAPVPVHQLPEAVEVALTRLPNQFQIRHEFRLPPTEMHRSPENLRHRAGFLAADFTPPQQLCPGAGHQRAGDGAGPSPPRFP